MASECMGCSASVDDREASCPKCGRMSEPGSSATAKPMGKRLSIPFATIVAVGFAGALVFGGGKAAHGQPSTAGPRVSVSVDGQFVPIRAPALASLERQLRPIVSHPRSPPH